MRRWPQASIKALRRRAKRQGLLLPATAQACPPPVVARCASTQVDSDVMVVFLPHQLFLYAMPREASTVAT